LKGNAIWQSSRENPSGHRGRQPKHGPVQLIKVDIADGFYCIWLNVHDIPKLGVVIPNLYGDEPLLAPPLVLPIFALQPRR
jgi:hypothetical protein